MPFSWMLTDSVFSIGIGRCVIFIVDSYSSYLSNMFVEIVQNATCMSGHQGKGQRRVMAVHVVDALFICGTDVRQLHYNERHVLQSLDYGTISQRCLLFVLLIKIFSILFLLKV